MGISKNHFSYYILKQPIKGKYLVVKVGNMDVIVYNSIYKPSISTKSIPVCVTKMDTGVSYEFASVCLFL
jgi:hypothetical protein